MSMQRKIPISYHDALNVIRRLFDMAEKQFFLITEVCFKKL